MSVAHLPKPTPAALDGGVYLQAEAAHLSGLPLSTLRRWLELERGPGEHAAFSPHPLVSFRDLISLRVVAALRRAGLTLLKIKAGADAIRRERGLAHPLTWERLKLDGVTRYFPAARSSVTTTNAGEQVTAQEWLTASLQDVKYKPRAAGYQLATSWEPPGVRIDPSIQRGAPCVTGSRVQIAQLQRYHDAGDTLAYLAELFELDAEEIRRAIDWYARPTLTA